MHPNHSHCLLKKREKGTALDVMGTANGPTGVTDGSDQLFFREFWFGLWRNIIYKGTPIKLILKK